MAEADEASRELSKLFVQLESSYHTAVPMRMYGYFSSVCCVSRARCMQVPCTSLKPTFAHAGSLVRCGLTCVLPARQRMPDTTMLCKAQLPQYFLVALNVAQALELDVRELLFRFHYRLFSRTLLTARPWELLACKVLICGKVNHVSATALLRRDCTDRPRRNQARQHTIQGRKYRTLPYLPNPTHDLPEPSATCCGCLILQGILHLRSSVESTKPLPRCAALNPAHLDAA